MRAWQRDINRECTNDTTIIGVSGKALKCGASLYWPAVNHTEVVLCPVCKKNAEWVKGNPATRHWPNNQNTGGENERS
jgi:hypothetical protein